MTETSIQARSSDRRPLHAWLIVILLSVIATCLLIEVGATATTAHGEVAAAAGNRDIVVVPGQLAENTYGLYLVDLRQSTICVYQFVPHARNKRFEFVAARTFVYDVLLDDWNNADPLPRDVKKIVASQQRLKDTAPGPKK